MPTVKCPKCSTMLKLQPQPTAVRVKCPKCATVLQIPAQPTAPKQAPAQQAPQQPAPQQPVPQQPAAQQQPVRQQPAVPQPTQQAAPAAADPFAGLPAPGAAPAAGANPFDFGNLPAAGAAAPDPFAAPAGFPGAVAPGTAAPADPFAGAPDPFAAMPAGNPAMAPGGMNPAAGYPAGNFAGGPAMGAPAPAASQPAPASPAPTRSGKKTGLIVGIAGGAVVLLSLIGGGIFFAVSSLGGGGSSSSSSSLAAADVPEGFQQISVAGISAAAPVGKAFQTPPTEAKSVAVQSEKTGAVFYLGVGEFIRKNATDREVAYRVGYYMMSDVIGGKPIEIGSVGGFQGPAYRGIILPDMEVQFFHVDDQVKIFACGLERPMYPTSARPSEEEIKAYEDAMEKYEAQMLLVEPEKQAFFESARL